MRGLARAATDVVDTVAVGATIDVVEVAAGTAGLTRAVVTRGVRPGRHLQVVHHREMDAVEVGAVMMTDECLCVCKTD